MCCHRRGGWWKMSVNKRDTWKTNRFYRKPNQWETKTIIGIEEKERRKRRNWFIGSHSRRNSTPLPRIQTSDYTCTHAWVCLFVFVRAFVDNPPRTKPNRTGDLNVVIISQGYVNLEFQHRRHSMFFNMMKSSIDTAHNGVILIKCKLTKSFPFCFVPIQNISTSKINREFKKKSRKRRKKLEMELITIDFYNHINNRPLIFFGKKAINI